MPAQTLQTDGFVLLTQPPGDAFQSLSVFASAHGTLLVMQRLAKKPGAATTLDLFDEASLLLETSNQGRTWFLKEARLITRNSAIGRSYDALRLASALAALIARNPVEQDSRENVAGLLRRAFAAFGSSDRPDIVYLKSLYRFARDEGYPVREQWFTTLTSADRAEVTTLINRPLSEQTATPTLVARLLRRLEDYLRGETELMIDPAT